LGADVKSKNRSIPTIQLGGHHLRDTEGNKFVIDNVALIGQNVTRYRFIKIPPLVSQTTVSQSDLLESETSIQLGVFDWRAWGAVRSRTRRKKKAVVKVHEARRNNLTYGVAWSFPAEEERSTGTIRVPGLPTSA